MAQVERAGYNDTTHHVEISAQDREIGPKAYDLFTEQFIRPLPWDIKAGRIEVYKKLDDYVKLETLPGEDYKPDLYERVILTEGLEKEQLDERLVRLTTVHKLIEDGLKDFMRRGTDVTRNNMGLSMSNIQWGREELQHGLALGLILEATGNRTPEDTKNEYYRNLEQTWEQPFPTEREIVFYGAFQEIVTGSNYFGMAREAQRCGAPITAKIFHLIAKDEYFHGGGYRAFAKLYAEQDLEGSIEDAVHVAADFRMPMQNLLPNRRQSLVDLHRAGIIDNNTIEHNLQKTLQAFGFVPEADIKRALQNYQKTKHN